jgi:hypothetical protein
VLLEYSGKAAWPELVAIEHKGSEEVCIKSLRFDRFDRSGGSLELASLARCAKLEPFLLRFDANRTCVRLATDTPGISSALSLDLAKLYSCSGVVGWRVPQVQKQERIVIRASTYGPVEMNVSVATASNDTAPEIVSMTPGLVTISTDAALVTTAQTLPLNVEFSIPDDEHKGACLGRLTWSLGSNTVKTIEIKHLLRCPQFCMQTYDPVNDCAWLGGEGLPSALTVDFAAEDPCDVISWTTPELADSLCVVSRNVSDFEQVVAATAELAANEFSDITLTVVSPVLPGKGNATTNETTPDDEQSLVMEFTSPLTVPAFSQLSLLSASGGLVLRPSVLLGNKPLIRVLGTFELEGMFVVLVWSCA